MYLLTMETLGKISWVKMRHELKATDIQSSEEITLFATPLGVFKSRDHGETWVEIEELRRKTSPIFA